MHSRPAGEEAAEEGESFEKEAIPPPQTPILADRPHLAAVIVTGLGEPRPFGRKGIFSDPNGPWRYGPSRAGPSPRRSALRDWQQAR